MLRVDLNEDVLLRRSRLRHYCHHHHLDTIHQLDLSVCSIRYHWTQRRQNVHCSRIITVYIF